MTKASTSQARERVQQRASQKPSESANPQTEGMTSFNALMKAYLNTDSIKARFEQVLANRAPQYMSSILNLVNNDKNLQACEPVSIISACMIAATLNLPVEKNLGYAWIVPYRDKKTGKVIATFQPGYKGYIQLALRTNKYRAINAITVCEGELRSWNPLTEELRIDFSQRKSDKVVGYAGYFQLTNGFRKTVYWTAEQIEAHRQRFSKTGAIWQTDYEAMGLKTVLRNMLSKWGILSIEMQEAYIHDEAEPENLLEDPTKPLIIDLNTKIEDVGNPGNGDHPGSPVPDSSDDGLTEQEPPVNNSEETNLQGDPFAD